MRPTHLISLTLAAALGLGLAACKKDAPAAAPLPPGAVAIDVTVKGFDPGKVTVPKGQPVTLVVTRRTDQTCAKEIVVPINDHDTVRKALPLNQPVQIAANFPQAGELTLACGMDMMHAVIAVQ